MSEFKLTARARIVILTAVLASLLEIIDTSIVNVSIPTMMGNLGATLDEISWVVTGYIIANAIVLPIAGWLGMQIGRKKYYTGCILLFTAASVACGLAPNLGVLVLFRIVQGFAGGALLPTSQALIQEQFPREKAGMANALYGMSVMVGPTLGPTLGGYLTDNFGWRMIFNINLPLGIAAAMLAYAYIDDVDVMAGQRDGATAGANTPRKRTPVDFVGLTLLALGVGSLQFVLERGQAEDWFSSGLIVIFTIAAVLAIPSFIWWELKTEHPIMNLRLYTHNALRNGTLLMAALGMFLYSLIFILPIFVNNVLGYDATQTGMLFIPGALVTAAMMPFIGGLLRKVDPRILIFIGLCLLEVTVVMMTGYNSSTGYWSLFWPLVVRGLGMAFLFVPINTVVLGQFSGATLGQVAGMMNLSRQLGGSIGIAALSTVLVRRNAQNFLNLSRHVSLLNPTTVQTLRGTQANLAMKLSNQLGLGMPSTGAIQALYFRVQKQVFIMSFNQMLFILFLAIASALIPLVSLKITRKLSGPVDAH